MSIWEKLGFGGYRGFSREAEQAVEEAKKWFRPELVGRLDELIVDVYKRQALACPSRRLLRSKRSCSATASRPTTRRKA